MGSIYDKRNNIGGKKVIFAGTRETDMKIACINGSVMNAIRRLFSLVFR